MVRDNATHIIPELNKRDPSDLTENLSEPDLIISNTCSVREKPVSKLFSETWYF